MDPKKKRAIIALASGVAAIIGIAAIAIPMMADAGTTTSSAGTVQISESKPVPTESENPYATARVIGQLASAVTPISSDGSANFWRIPSMHPSQPCQTARCVIPRKWPG